MRAGSLIFIGILLSLLMLLDWSVIEGLSPFIEDFANPGLKKIFRSFFLGMSFGVPVAMFGSYFLLGRRTWATATLGSVFLTLLVSKIVFLIALFVADLIGVSVLGLQNIFFFEKPFVAPDPELMKCKVAVCFGAFVFLAFLHGITVGKYKYTLHQHTVFLKDLPEAFDGFTITQISDVHSGSFHNSKAVARGVELIKKQQSDLFIFTGDLVNNSADEIEPWIELFSSIKAPFGKYSILGNHDYGDYMAWPSRKAKVANMQKLQENHARIGFQLLLDEHVLIEKSGEKIALLGIENWGLGFGKRGKLDQAIKGIPNGIIKILLSHDPSHWEHEVKKYNTHIHLTFSGHTHGMQLGIELKNWKWSPSKFRYPKWAGLYEESGKYLYVNRGFGFLGFSGRVGIWPEVTVLTLRKKGSE